MTRFQVEELSIVLDGSDAVRIDVLVLLLVFGDGVIRPTAFPESSGVRETASQM